MQLSAIMLGGLLFCSVSIGGAVAWVVSRLFQHTIYGLPLLSGGFLIGLLAYEIVPTAWEIYDSFGIILGGIIGCLLFLLLHQLFHPTGNQTSSVYLLTIAMLIHTIPLSLAIGNSLGSSAFSIAITTSVILHHVPEGFALTTALLSQGEKMWALFLCFIAFSVLFTVFIWVGHYMTLSENAQGILMGISIGLIAMTSISEFIIHHIRALSIKALMTYISLGFVLSYVFHMML
ncbi:MAG: zinc transporter family protein [Lysinibacillus sp.]